MSLERWALPQLSRILPLDNDSLKQILLYTEKLSAEAAAQHLKELIGDSSQALEFIASFNSRRRSESDKFAKPSGDASENTNSKSGKKKTANVSSLSPRHFPGNHDDGTGEYLKKKRNDPVHAKSDTSVNHGDSTRSTDMKESYRKPGKSHNQPEVIVTTPKLPPSASGPLISDVGPSPIQSSSSSSSNTKKSKVKVNISGGTPMHGKSTVLDDLDSAIRSLEIQTNPALAVGKHPAKLGKRQQEQKRGVGERDEDRAKRKCDCMATQHPLLTAAPNCLNCGKVICVSEGLGPCTFCDQPLLSSTDLHSMLRILREERGRERTNAHNASHKRADKASPTVSTARKLGALNSSPRSSALTSDAEGVNGESDDSNDIDNNKLDAARLHRDKLLAFQAQNSQRTRVHDEAADYDMPIAGLSMWASPQERALQLKQQQKVLREQEWNARPEYEKRKMVVSVDLVGGKVVKRMVEVERPASPPKDETVNEDGYQTRGNDKSEGKDTGGAFSRNPLLGSLIKPKIDSKARLTPHEGTTKKSATWRRVQDDNDDNEQVILSGSLYGGENIDRTYGIEEAVH